MPDVGGLREVRALPAVVGADGLQGVPRPAAPDHGAGQGGRGGRSRAAPARPAHHVAATAPALVSYHGSPAPGLVRGAVRGGAGGTVWLPWLTTRAAGGGRASAIGGTVGSLVLPPRFGAGQLIVLLASALIVTGAMAARNLSPRLAASGGTGDLGASGGVLTCGTTTSMSAHRCRRDTASTSGRRALLARCCRRCGRWSAALVRGGEPPEPVRRAGHFDRRALGFAGTAVRRSILRRSRPPPTATWGAVVHQRTVAGDRAAG